MSLFFTWNIYDFKEDFGPFSLVFIWNIADFEEDFWLLSTIFFEITRGRSWVQIWPCFLVVSTLGSFWSRLDIFTVSNFRNEKRLRFVHNILDCESYDIHMKIPGWHLDWTSLKTNLWKSNDFSSENWYFYAMKMSVHLSSKHFLNTFKTSSRKKSSMICINF